MQPGLMNPLEYVLLGVEVLLPPNRLGDWIYKTTRYVPFSFYFEIDSQMYSSRKSTNRNKKHFFLNEEGNR